MQQAIDILDEMIKNRMQSTKVQEGGHEDILHNADMRYEINILNEIKSRIQALGDGWIPTSIRLPEPNKNVLLWEGGYEPLELNEPIIGWYNTRYGFRTKGDGPIATHWMPLPNPPKQ